MTAPDHGERVALISEIAAGETERSTFSVSRLGGGPISLQLSTVGCSCYRVRHGDRILRVGDALQIPAGQTTDLCIEAQVRTTPGVAQYRAEFIGTDIAGDSFTVPLINTVRTIADLTLRPDVFHYSVRQAPTGHRTEFEMAIEQHVRTQHADQLQINWISVPEWITCAQPARTEPAVEIAPGIWRVQWRSVVRLETAPDPLPQAPVLLRLDSRNGNQRLAQAECSLIVDQSRGIQAPAIVHFGRVASGDFATRRIQLLARDGRPYSITSLSSESRRIQGSDLTAQESAEHWIAVRIDSNGTAIDDALHVTTDHPEAGRIQIRVVVLASAHAAPAE